MNYFSDDIFRALMDIIYEEMQRNNHQSGGNYDHKMYGLILQRDFVDTWMNLDVLIINNAPI